MRWISVEPGDVEEQPGGTVASGVDDYSMERVTFTISLDMAKAVRSTTGATLVPVPDEDVIRVQSNPEWDSPGTSPEEGS